jgi:hypothetical protein
MMFWDVIPCAQLPQATRYHILEDSFLAKHVLIELKMVYSLTYEDYPESKDTKAITFFKDIY